MNNKLIITKNPYNEHQILSFIQENGRVAQILTEESNPTSDNPYDNIKVSQIYLGKVQSIAKNINAAFIEVQKGALCFLSLEELYFPIKQGDEFPVQIIREAIGIKQPVCSTSISLSGEYCVCRMEHKNGVFFSKKIPNEIRKEMEAKLKVLNTPYSFVIRTNASKLTEFSLLSEDILYLTNEMNSLIQKAKTRTCFSLLKDCIPSYITYIKEFLHKHPNEQMEAITDIYDVYDALQSNLNIREQESVKITHYTDSFSLVNLYSLKTVLSDALSSKVWLKSGAFLVIESTEALVSIDVNTGKNIGNKSKEETILKVNLEAAQEIAFQLRLRNLSGIIIIDFINMDITEHNNLLMRSLKEFVGIDNILTNVIDMTKLGLIEVTRKKIGKPLYEILKKKDKS